MRQISTRRQYRPVRGIKAALDGTTKNRGKLYEP